jgi:uncharacterized protein YaaQ
VSRIKKKALLLAIVQHEDVESALRALSEMGLQATCISSLGGFLRAGNVTLMVDAEHDDLDRALTSLGTSCRQRTIFVSSTPPAPLYGADTFIMPLEVEVGGATAFVLPIERFVRLGAQKEDVIQGSRNAKESMKLIIAIVPEENSGGILDNLMTAQYRATLISTTGGLLRKGNATLLIGAENEKGDDVVKRIEDNCPTPSAENGADSGAMIFVLDVERFSKI